MYQRLKRDENALDVFKKLFGDIINEKLVELILDYFEDSDYVLLCNEKYELKRMDVAEVNGECVDYSTEDVLQILCRWQEEFKQIADEDFASGHLSEEAYKAKKAQLESNEKLLHALCHKSNE